MKPGQQLVIEVRSQHAIKADESVATVQLELQQLLASVPGVWRPRILLDEQVGAPTEHTAAVAATAGPPSPTTAAAASSAGGGAGSGSGGARAHWLPDSAVTQCGSCSQGFSLRHRRHHCRSCGGIFCAACTAYRSRSGAGAPCCVAILN